MSQHSPHCHSSRWKADSGKEPSLGSRCRCRGEHRALTALINDEWSDVTIVFGHSNPPMLWGGLAVFLRLPGARSSRETARIWRLRTQSSPVRAGIGKMKPFFQRWGKKSPSSPRSCWSAVGTSAPKRCAAETSCSTQLLLHPHPNTAEHLLEPHGF